MARYGSVRLVQVSSSTRFWVIDQMLKHQRWVNNNNTQYIRLATRNTKCGGHNRIFKRRRASYGGSRQCVRETVSEHSGSDSNCLRRLVRLAGDSEAAKCHLQTMKEKVDTGKAFVH